MHFLKKMLLLFGILLQLFSKVYALDCCHYAITPENILFHWGSSDQLEITNIDISYSPSLSWTCWMVDCSRIYVDFSRGSSATYNRLMTQNQNKLHYNIYKKATINTPLTLKEDAQSINNYFRRRFKQHKQLKVKIYAKLPIPNQGSTFFPKGTYQDAITVRVYPQVDWGNSSLANALVPISVTIPPTIQLSLVDTGAPFDPNDTEQNLLFGELKTNQSRNFDIRIKSNAGYAISFSSTNNGHLKNTQMADFIPYKTVVNGQTYDLTTSSSGPVEVARASGITQETGAVIHTQITILEVANHHAGQYQDIVTITAMATD